MVFDSGFEFDARGEPRHAFSGHFHRMPAAGVTHTPRLAMGDSEGAESGNYHPVPSYQAGLNSLQKSVQRASGLRPRQPRLNSDLAYEFPFGHDSALSVLGSFIKADLRCQSLIRRQNVTNMTIGPARMLYCRFETEILMTQETVRIVALILLLIVIAIIFLRRKAKKKKEDDEF